MRSARRLLTIVALLPGTLAAAPLAPGTSPDAPLPRTADTILVETTVVSGPPALTNQTSATFSFSSDVLGASFECAPDPTSFVPCTSPHTVTDLAEGAQVLFVRAIDGAVPDPSPALYIWTVDLTAPDTTVDAGPSGTTLETGATFQFSGSEPGASFQCSLDASPFGACTSPLVLQGLASGAHTLAVRAVDLAGNADPTPAARAWTVEGAFRPPTPPDTTPPGRVTTLRAQGDNRRVVLTWTNPADPDLARVEVVRSPGDDLVFSGLATTATIRGLQNGLLYTFEVTAVDRAGNRSAIATTRGTPLVRLLFAPANGELVTAPPLLAWRPARKADFYNVQVYLRKRKVLSTWPTRAQLKLERTWRFAGTTQRLRPGVYVWYVWPGFGTPSAATYGKLLGRSTFVVSKPEP